MQVLPSNVSSDALPIRSAQLCKTSQVLLREERTSSALTRALYRVYSSMMWSHFSNSFSTNLAQTRSRRLPRARLLSRLLMMDAQRSSASASFTSSPFFRFA